jgi:hypothetical protein
MLLTQLLSCSGIFGQLSNAQCGGDLSDLDVKVKEREVVEEGSRETGDLVRAGITPEGGFVRLSRPLSCLVESSSGHHGLVAAFTGGYGMRGRILSEDRMMR